MTSRKQEQAAQRRVLFGVFVVIFSLTALLAIAAVIYIFVAPERAKENPILERVMWALWSTLLVEVAGGIFALFKDLFGLHTEEKVTKLSNELAEIIDGLEAEGTIDTEKADALREQYGKSGAAGETKDKNGLS